MDNANPQISEFSNSIGKALQTLIQQTVDKLDRVDTTENMEGLVNKIADVVQKRIDTEDQIDTHSIRLIAEEVSHSEDQIRQMATDEIDNYDFGDILDSNVESVVHDYDFSEAIADALEGADLSDKITEAIETADLTNEVTNVLRYADLSSHIEEALSDYDIREKLEDALSDTDFTTYVEDALDTYDFDHKIEEAVNSSTSPIATVSELKAIEDRQHEILNALQKMGEAIRSISPVQI